MLEIKNLTKVYKTSRKEKCTAINDVTLDLPSTGMIFVTGKSGSGKSTLLNMIGTLDNITRGDIVVDGNSFSKFKEKDLQEYRSSYLGFIFQDFLLLEELTVIENISLALKISGYEKEEYLDEIIKRVDLVGKEDKFPNELSGGQRQRVAIARALVKDPKMLLCDEPTGNLDYKTSKQILDILKEESKTKLVLVVSHNLEDAENYADRIIELMDGKIVKDYTKNKDYSNNLVITEKHVILPHHKDLTIKEVTMLNEKLKNDKFKVMQNKGGFFPTKNIEMVKKDFVLQSSHLDHKNSVKLSSMFFRKNKHGAPYTIIITALFISLFYIFQVFITFNGNNSVKNIESEEALAVINISDKTILGTLSQSSILTIPDEMVNEYYENGYTGDVYKLYNYGISIKRNIISVDNYNRLTSLYEYNEIGETLGTLCCSEEYLKSIYANEDNELVILAGDLNECYDKLIITDYIADILINQSKNVYMTYEDCYLANDNVGAIIYTGYKERYSDVIENGQSAEITGLDTSEYFQKYSQDENFVEFLKEVQTHLGICYTFTDNFYEDIVYNSTSKTLNLSNVYVEYREKNNMIESGFNVTLSSSFVDNNIEMSYSTYNELFGTFYTAGNLETFVPHDVVFRKYYNNDPTQKIEFEETLHIEKLGTSTTISQELYNKFYHVKYHVYGLYFNNLDQRELVMDVSNKQGMIASSIDTAVVPVINTILEVFKGFCYLIIILLFAVSFTHIVFYGISSIRKNIYEIGVLKALGAKSIDIAKIFIIQIAIMGFAISLVSILGIYLSTIISNLLLVTAFEDFLSITIFGLNVIVLRPSIISLDLTLVFVLSIISSIIPLIYLKTIKPLNILKGKKK